LRTPGSSGRCDSATKLRDSPSRSTAAASVKAILLSVSFGFVSVIFDAISPDKVFLFLVNSSGAVALFCYVLIAVAELRTRRRLEAEAPERLKRFISLAVVLVAGWLRYRQTGARASVGGTQPSRT
jgi:L-asparagine transporter-like permease